jgi:kynurenine formamidase
VTIIDGDTVVDYMSTLSNWGRWGVADRLGTVNLVTDECRRAAAGQVTAGISVSCAHDIDPTAVDPIHQFHRYMVVSGEGLSDAHRVPHMAGAKPDQRWSPSREYIGMVFHGPRVTHLDAPSHMAWDGKVYNGYPAERVNSVSGALDLPVSALQAGVTTRGVLLDVVTSRGPGGVEGGSRIGPDELVRIEAQEGVEVHDGDVVFLRTGSAFAAGGDGPAIWNWQDAKSGWSAACLPWFRERGVAMIGHDGSNDAAPSGYESVDFPTPIHVVSLVAMGLWLLDNVALDELALTCQRLQRWEFMISVAPWRLLGGTGSPVNPIATF